MEKKTKIVPIRFTPKEIKQIAKEADTKGMKISAYVRMMANQSPRDYPEIRAQLKTLINEVNHIGNNINQITKNNNSKLYFEQDKRKLYAYMQKLNLTMQEVVKVVSD